MNLENTNRAIKMKALAESLSSDDIQMICLLKCMETFREISIDMLSDGEDWPVTFQDGCGTISVNSAIDITLELLISGPELMDKYNSIIEESTLDIAKWYPITQKCSYQKG